MKSLVAASGGRIYGLSWCDQSLRARCGSTVIDAKLIRIDLAVNVYRQSRLSLGTVTHTGLADAPALENILDVGEVVVVVLLARPDGGLSRRLARCRPTLLPRHGTLLRRGRRLGARAGLTAPRQPQLPAAHEPG